jgi:hypothetical protein|tara:strand:+ start:102 stop:269 length:168 start_codon:yes stop_codon:yes gene_type:complete
MPPLAAAMDRVKTRDAKSTTSSKQVSKQLSSCQAYDAELYLMTHFVEYLLWINIP